MTKVKKIILFLASLGILVFLFWQGDFPENPQFQEILNSTAGDDVIIIFNSGGWGNTPLEKAEDFAPIIRGIQETLNQWGYHSIAIPYTRTKNDFFGKITGAREFFNSFKNSSEDLAKEIEFLTKNLPDKKIIITGLSAGGALVDETMEKITEEARSSVYAITAGVPFWHDSFNSKNILRLNNNGKDSLAVGDIKSLILSLIEAPFRRSQQMRPIAVGHWYSWDSPEVNEPIVNFLKEKFQN